MHLFVCWIIGDPETTDEDIEHEYSSLAELHRKTVAGAFWAGEVEAEWREHDNGFVFRSGDDKNVFMTEVDKKRAVTTYEHDNCSKACKKRGEFGASEL